MHNYHDTHKRFPALGYFGENGNPGIGIGNYSFSWAIFDTTVRRTAAVWYDAMMTAKPQRSGAGLPTPWDTSNNAWVNTNWKKTFGENIAPRTQGPPSARKARLC